MKNGLIIDEIGTKRYYLNDLLHREDGSAVEYPDGEKYWFQNDKLHRLDGPAVEYTDSSKGEWWYQDQYIDCKNQEEFERLIKLLAFW